MGVDGVKSRQLGHTMKWVMRGLPVLMFPFLLKFPAVSRPVLSFLPSTFPRLSLPSPKCIANISSSDVWPVKSVSFLSVSADRSI